MNFYVVDISGIDGFNFINVNFPTTFKDIAKYLIAELRKGCLAWDSYPVPGGIFKENLYGIKGLSVPCRTLCSLFEDGERAQERSLESYLQSTNPSGIRNNGYTNK